MTVAYFAMASDLGWTVVRSEFGHYQGKGLERQVFWVRVSPSPAPSHLPSPPATR